MASKKKKTKTSEVPVTPEAVAVKKTVSAVYPAIQPVEAPEPVPEVKEVKEPSPPAEPPKTHRKGKAAASWAVQVAVVAIPAIISGYVTRQNSKDEAEAGYKAMVTAVQELQDATRELVEQQAYMQGELDALRNEASKLHGKALPRPASPKSMKPTVVLSNLPADLNDAVKSKGRPYEQSTLVFAPPAPELFNDAEKVMMDDVAKKRATAVEEMEKKRAAEKDTHPAAPPH